MEGTVFTPCLESIKHVKSEQGEMLTKQFLDVCKLILPVIDKFGAAMALVKSDIGGNITRLENKYSTNPSKYNILYTMVQEEVAANTAKGSSSCTNGLLWLTRAMDFLVELFRNLLDHQDWTMSQACSEAYAKTLKKWHGWLASSTFSMAMKLAPDRTKFMEVIGGTGDIKADIQAFYANFSPLLEENHKFLKNVKGKENPQFLKKVFPSAKMSNKSVKGLLKGLRYISKVFDEEQDEPEMQIGYPTDVKHVGHIGCDGENNNIGPTWMNNFKPNQEEDTSARPNGQNANEATETKGKIHSKLRLAAPSKDGTSSPVSSPTQRATDGTKKSTKHNASTTGRHRSSRRDQGSNQGADPGLQDSNPPVTTKKVRRKKKVSSEGGSTRSAKSREKTLSIDRADPDMACTELGAQG